MMSYFLSCENTFLTWGSQDFQIPTYKNIKILICFFCDEMACIEQERFVLNKNGPIDFAEIAEHKDTLKFTHTNHLHT